jgi:hypothetical protein
MYARQSYVPAGLLDSNNGAIRKWMQCIDLESAISNLHIDEPRGRQEGT